MFTAIWMFHTHSLYLKRRFCFRRSITIYIIRTPIFATYCTNIDRCELIGSYMGAAMCEWGAHACVPDEMGTPIHGLNGIAPNWCKHSQLFRAVGMLERCEHHKSTNISVLVKWHISKMCVNAVEIHTHTNNQSTVPTIFLLVVNSFVPYHKQTHTCTNN